MNSNKILIRFLNVRTVKMIIVLSLLSVSLMGCVSKDKNENTLAPSETLPGVVQVVFKNKQIEKAVREEIKKETGEITNSNLEEINNLSLGFTIKSTEDIKELTSLINLTDLELKFSDGIDISRLSELSKLSALRLDGKPADLAFLGNFKQLSYLSLL